MKLPQSAGLFGVALFLLQLRNGESLECTKGRLFVADNETSLHVLDLDSVVDGVYEEIATLILHKSGLSVLATETELATVMTRDRSDDTTKGVVNFYRPGLTAVEENGAIHVSKTDPSALSFEITGWKPTHIESSEGFLAVFMDGAEGDDVPLPGHPETHPKSSAAVFVKESEVVAESGSPTVIEVPVVGKHHGVAYALDEDRFLITLTTEGDLGSLPENFKVTDETGAVIQTLGTADKPLCPDYHGSAHVDHDWIFGCAEAGLLHLSYDHDSKMPTTQLLPFPPPHNGDDMIFRSSTVRGHESGRLYAADFSHHDAYRNPRPPYYVIPLAHGASRISAQNLVDISRSDTERTHCFFQLDRAKHDSGVMLLVLHKDGNLQVVPLSSCGVPGTAAYVEISAEVDCANTQMVTGYGYAYIFIGGEKRELYTVDLKEVLEGHLDHAVTRMQLSFTPGSAALALPPTLACDNNMNDDPEGDNAVCAEDEANGAAGVVPASGLLLSMAAPLLIAAK